MRHTWASWHIQRGISLRELMDLGGWSSYEMDLRYSHLASNHLSHAVSRIERTNLAQMEIIDGHEIS
jgi:integrase